MSDGGKRLVYKFYDDASAIRNLEQYRLKISTFDDLNDPFELNGISFPTKESRLTWRNFCREFSQQFGLICFSEDWRNPVIWSHYANKHRGLALGFEIPKNHLIEVKYRDKRRSFPNLTDTDSSELAPL